MNRKISASAMVVGQNTAESAEERLTLVELGPEASLLHQETNPHQSAHLVAVEHRDTALSLG